MIQGKTRLEILVLQIDFFPMPKGHNIHNKFAIKYFVNNTVVTNPNPVTFSAFKFYITLWSWILF